MKILMVTSTYPFGEAESFVDAELEALLDEGCDVDVFPVYPRGGVGDKRFNSIIYLKLFEVRYLIDLFFFFFLKPIFFWGLLRLSISSNFVGSLRNLVVLPKLCHFYRNKKTDYDFVYAYWASIPAQFAMLYSYLCGIKWAFCAHRWDIVEANNFKKKLSNCIFARFISTSGVGLLDPNIFSKYRQKIHVIHMGVSVANLNKSTGNIKPVNRLICIANLLPVKGISYLIKSMSLLKNNELLLDILGDGQEKASLVQLVKDLGLEHKVRFCGFIPHDEVLKYLKDNNYLCLVLPSVDLGNGLHEGIPVVLMEAMACGVPVISTNTGGIPELIGSKSEYGLCVPPASVIDLAYAIDYLLENSKIRDDYIVKGYERVSSKFDSRNNALIILSLMKDALSSHS